MYIKNYRAKKLIDGASHEITYSVAIEDTIELFVNNIHMAAILATPEMLKELAFGYLICEGMVKAPGDIRNMNIDGKTIHVHI
jgi:FdhD protein